MISRVLGLVRDVVLANLIGANGNFATVPDAAKWVMAFGMLLGRLELFTVLVMLTPAFWSS